VAEDRRASDIEQSQTAGDRILAEQSRGVGSTVVAVRIADGPGRPSSSRRDFVCQHHPGRGHGDEGPTYRWIYGVVRHEIEAFVRMTLK
jgi:hypothetical protein